MFWSICIYLQGYRHFKSVTAHLSTHLVRETQKGETSKPTSQPDLPLNPLATSPARP